MHGKCDPQRAMFLAIKLESRVWSDDSPQPIKRAADAIPVGMPRFWTEPTARPGV